MKVETPQQVEAFMRYYAMHPRSMRRVAEDMGVGRSTIPRWKETYKWDSRINDLDEELNNELVENMMGDWALMKTYLLKALITQVEAGINDNIRPRNTGDIVSAIREIRSMIGDTGDESNKPEKIEYVRTLTNDETSSGNKDI